MDEVNRTLYIPLYGKARLSRRGIILSDPDAERIWSKEGFAVHGKAASKWLAYNMAMRARVFDEWTEEMLRSYPDAVVLHIGCGLDARCRRVKTAYHQWIDCDLADVITVRRRYFSETDTYRMQELDASDAKQIQKLPQSDDAIVILEGLSMYLTNEQVRDLLAELAERYKRVHILMDVYTVFAARASKYKNPVNEVGVNTLYGIDGIDDVIKDTPVRFVREHSFTPAYLVEALPKAERLFFRMMFVNRLYGRIYRLLELETK